MGMSGIYHLSSRNVFYFLVGVSTYSEFKLYYNYFISSIMVEFVINVSLFICFWRKKRSTSARRFLACQPKPRNNFPIEQFVKPH